MLPIFLATSLTALAAVELDVRTHALEGNGASLAVSRPALLAQLGRAGLAIEAPGFAIVGAEPGADGSTAPIPARWSDGLALRTDLDFRTIGDILGPARPSRPITLGDRRSVRATPPFRLATIIPGYGRITPEQPAASPEGGNSAARSSSR